MIYKKLILKVPLFLLSLFLVLSCSSDDDKAQDYPVGYVLNYTAKLTNTEGVYEVSFINDDINSAEDNTITHDVEEDGIASDSNIGAGTFFEIENNIVGVKFSSYSKRE